MFLVVGLGNPGTQYTGTRHNVGFEVIDALARRARADMPRTAKNAEVCRATVAGRDGLLVKPLTFMNLSGQAVGELVRYYKIDAADVLVVHDELDFSVGQVRLKDGGGHGGHNGLRSLHSHVGTSYGRVRVGIGKPASAASGADYVLSRFDATSRKIMDEAVIVACEAVETILAEGMAPAMNRFNRGK